MEITVRYFTLLRNVTGKSEEKINAQDGSNVQDILTILDQKYGKEFERFIYSGREHRGLKLLFFVDGRNIEAMDGFKTKLRNGSVLAVIPPVAGG